MADVVLSRQDVLREADRVIVLGRRHWFRDLGLRFGWSAVIAILSANKWCELWVQVQMFKGQMVLERGWEYFCCRHKIVPDGLLVFRLSGLGLKVQIFNANTSNIYRVRRSKHSCVDDIMHAT
ncbi:hypothetical protein ACQJBY_069276 [Aegilops geniculata]